MTTDPAATPPAAPFSPILLDLPDCLETERLVVRAPRPGDGAMLLGSLLETLDDLRRFPASMSWALAEQTLASAESWCRTGAAHWLLRSDFPFLLVRRDGRHVGNCGVHRFDWSRRVFEVGWWCRSADQGHGYVTEAMRAIVAFCFDHLGARRVWCLCDEQNRRSCAVAERLGFAYEGTVRSDRADPDGTRRNMRMYAEVR